MVENNTPKATPFYSDEQFLFHPKAEVFELMSPKELNALGASIERNGQRDPIELFESKILEGRNRYLACKLFNITPCFICLPEDIDPDEYVDDKNVFRRHLPTAQRADRAVQRLEEEKKKAHDRKLSHLIQNDKKTVPP